MKVEPVFPRGRSEATAVRITLTEKDAIDLAAILSYASNSYDQNTGKHARRIFNVLAATCEHLNADARTFAERQNDGWQAEYHAMRLMLDPGYES